MILNYTIQASDQTGLLEWHVLNFFDICQRDVGCLQFLRET